ncbi:MULTISPECIES: MarR family winged helix-turn-helix transcriptional regulator [Microbacterium]|uniref:MarR family winged helix-turn-helix transcriptional regulator n=1 Tax=Microbacterium TaxID=33882 RepID=UPI002782DEB6|nr:MULTISPECIES: MarR family transcriptional regulator [Microbacterium]MDQ1083372.1 DNA-binding MarR family transcriptional regulator [Microbacterium sp. SORGH_AS_0344]MDQ1171348.1 DNA-binding MarR family transcriptional regulator [Microbacterium proteolyticum]
MTDVESTPRARPSGASPVADVTYWYGDEPADRRQRSKAVLEALRIYRAAEVAMRRRTRDSMSMGENELLVLRYLLRTPSRGVRPGELTKYLGLSTASTTAILDRLERSGHVTRAANPDDRRSIFIQVTPKADAEVRQTLGNMHDRMLAAVIDMTPEESAAVVAFLHRMSDAVDGVAVELPAVDSP